MRNKKVLVITVNAWNDNGILNTMQNIFQDYDADLIYSLYLRSDLPNTKYCAHSFQVSEMRVYKKLFSPSLKIGKRVNSVNNAISSEFKQEGSAKRIYRLFNSNFVLLCREFIWGLNLWKENDLVSYLKEANPDIIFTPVSSYLYTNRIVDFVCKMLPNAKLALFFVDDNFTYKAVSNSPFALLHRLLLRKKIRTLVDKATFLYAISPKMQDEYGTFFGKNFDLLTKSVEVDLNAFHKKESDTCGDKLTIVYIGNLLYGRILTLLEISNAIENINRNSVKKIHLVVYTQTEVSVKYSRFFQRNNYTQINKAIPYSEVKKVLSESDVLLYMESFYKSKYRVARLSFSTKITDCLASGKPILAIGPKDIAPMEYLKNNECAIVIDDPAKIHSEMKTLVENFDHLNKIKENAYQCCLKNHSRERNKKNIVKMLNK